MFVVGIQSGISQRSLFVVLIVTFLVAGCQEGRGYFMDESQQSTAEKTPASQMMLSPEQVVASYYEWYLAGEENILDGGMFQRFERREYLGHPLLTTAFISKVEGIRDHLPESGISDPFLCSVAQPGEFAVTLDNEDSINAGVDLSFIDTGMTLRIALQQQDGRWLISDVICP